MSKIKTSYKAPDFSDDKTEIIAQAIEIFEDQDKYITITIKTTVRKPLTSKTYSITQKENFKTPISSFPGKTIVTYEEEETKHERKEVVEYIKKEIRKLLKKK